MKSGQQAKKLSAEATKPETAEANRPVWFLGKEIGAKPAAEESDEGTAKDDADASEAPEMAQDFLGRRPTQLEAYMRYAQMREPEDEETLAPIKTRRFPPGYASNENDGDWDGASKCKRPTRRAPSGVRARDAILAGLASIAIGTLAGAVVYDRTHNGELSTTVFASLGGYMTGLNGKTSEIADAQTAGLQVKDSQATAASFKKPVTTARLDVADAKGNVNTLIPLSISAEPAMPDQDIALRLSGLPADAYLTAGTKLANNAWILRLGEANGVKLMVPSAQTSPLLISVDAIEPRTGDLAAPPEEMSVALTSDTPPAPQVEPASAPPEDVKKNFNLPPQENSLPPEQKDDTAAAQPIPAPLENSSKSTTADSASLMRNGDKLLGLGDITAARAFFSKARDLGDRQASLKLGQTYDPVVFGEKNVQGLKPDPALALKYYLEARTAGIAEADNAITGLDAWMKKK